MAFKNYTVHSPFDDELLSNAGPGGPRLSHNLAALVARRVDSRNMVHAHRVHTLSCFTLDLMLSKHRRIAQTKVTVSPGWVEADRFQPATEREAVRRRLGPLWNTSRPLFFTLRRLENRMGIDTLIQACGRLKQQGLPFRALIGGGGSLRNELQNQIDQLGLQDDVYLLGRLPEDDLPLAYAAADCFVLPTRALECFGLIVLEAFACNTPVIASRVAAIPELAERQGPQWMFAAGDAEQLAKRMKAFVSRELSVRTDLRGIAIEYDMPRILKQWETLLQPGPNSTNCTDGNPGAARAA